MMARLRCNGRNGPRRSVGLMTPTADLGAATRAAKAAAQSAADRAGVVIVEMVEIPAIERACALLTRVWGNPPEHLVIEPHLVRAFALSGQQVLGAYEATDTGAAGDPLAVSIAWLARDAEGLHLHSHITGVAPRSQGRDIGFAVKLAQRAWTLERGITTIRWTFDPLVRRNAFFNLCKLGAVADRFHVDLYGAMTDATNAGDESDRFEVCWNLTDERVIAASECKAREPDISILDSLGAAAILDVDADGAPMLSPSDAPILLARVPRDALHLRTERPDLSRAWRLATREALGGAIAGGFIATGMTRAGWYVLPRMERGDR